MEENDHLKKFLKEPIAFLEKGIEKTSKVEHVVISKHPFRLAEEYWDTLGPGLTTGAADDDPSGIATYSQTGARYGFQLLWLAAFTFPLMAIVQEMCARIGIVTGRGLAANIRHHYSRTVLYTVTTLLFVANTFNIGADLGAMAQGIQLLDPNIAFMFLVVIFACTILLLQIFTTYAHYAKYLKYLSLVLLAYVFSALLSNLNWHEVALRAFIPSMSFNKDQIYLICAILGTTVSPYLFFWQTSQEVEEQNLHSVHTLDQHSEGEQQGLHEHTARKDIRKLRIDVW